MIIHTVRMLKKDVPDRKVNDEKMSNSVFTDMLRIFVR